MAIRFDAYDHPLEAVPPPACTGIVPPTPSSLVLNVSKDKAIRLASELLRRAIDARSNRVEITIDGVAHEHPAKAGGLFR